jgi:aldose 1-epimerase
MVRQMAAFPLVPYSNRIENAMLMFEGRQYRLRENFPPEKHAIHGFGWKRAWQVVRHAETRIELRLDHVIDEDWPFACNARYEIRLEENALHLYLQLTNAGRQSMPAGLGFHPFFPIGDGLHLQAHWKAMWKMGDNNLPTRLGEVPDEANFSELRPVAGWKVDHCFTGWDGRLTLDYATHRVQLTASDPCRQIVCFAPNDGRNFIALEPVSHINNAFALASRGEPDTGMRILGPGESLSISMSLHLQSHHA